MGRSLLKKDSEEIKKRIYSSSLNTAIIILALVAVIEMFMFAATIVNKSFYEGYELRYRYFYIFMFLLSTILVLMSLWIKKDLSRRYMVLDVAYPLSAILYYGWVLAVTYSDSSIIGSVDPTAFMTFSLAVPLCFYMPPVLYDSLSESLTRINIGVLRSHFLFSPTCTKTFF